MITTLIPQSVAEGDADWSPTGGTNTAVVADDSDATLTTPNLGLVLILYDMSDMGTAASITSYSHVYRTQGADGTVTSWAKFKLSGTTVTGSGRAGTGSVVEYTEALARPGGGSWDVASVNATTAGFEGNWGTAAPSFYKLRTQVDFVPVIGGFISMVGQWLGPVVAVGLGDMARIAAAVHARSRTLIKPEEYRQAWQELRAALYPAHFLAPRTGWRPLP